MKILITGGNGLLASNLIFNLFGNHSILSLSRSNKISYKGTINKKVDFLNMADLVEVFREFRPDIVINTVSLTAVEACEENFYDAYISNVQTAINIARASKEAGAKLVHISTDHFCDSNFIYSTENQTERPKNNYAITKQIAEKEVFGIDSTSLVIRTNFFGWGHKFKGSFSDFIISNLRMNKEVKLFADVFYTPIITSDLCKAIIALINNKEEGVFNVVSKDRLSKYDFGLKIAKMFDLDASLIVAASINDTSLTPRPTEMSLSNAKLVKSLGRDFSFSVDNALNDLKCSENDLKEFYSQTIFSNTTNFISYGRQSISPNDISSVVDTLNGNFLTQGPKVSDFEARIAKYTGARYAVAMSNLTTAMHAGVIALGLKEGDYIITSPNTFVTSSNVALFCKAIPLFADINPKTLNLCTKNVQKLLDKYGCKVKIIIPVHFAGAPCDVYALKELAEKYNCKILEDAAHGLGGSYPDGAKIGACTHSDITGFSFHPVKNITTGEGGALTTNSLELYKSLLRIRSHGIIKDLDSCVLIDQAYTNGELNPWYYEMQEIGFNYRITDLQCALGVSQLERVDKFHSRRVEIGLIYDREFEKLQNIRPYQAVTRKISGNHLYVCHVNLKSLGLTKIDLFKKFKERGVLLHVHYIPVTIQPYYQFTLNTKREDCPRAVDYYETAITLPFYHSMTNEQVYQIVDVVKEVIG